MLAKAQNPNFWYIVKTGKNYLLLLTKIMGKTYWEEEEISKYLSNPTVSSGLDSPVIKSTRKRGLTSPKTASLAKKHLGKSPSVGDGNI